MKSNPKTMTNVEHKWRADDGSASEVISPRQAWRALVRRKTIVGIFLIFGLTAGILASLRPRHFSATGMIQVRAGASAKYNLEKIASTLNTDTEDQLQSDVEVLQSRDIALSVARDLQLEKEPAIFGKKSMSRPLSLDVQADRTLVLDAIIKSTKVQRVPATEMITISCTTISPVLSSRIVNAMIESYIKRTFRSRYESTQRASDWLRNQLGDLKAQVESDQTHLLDLQKKLGEIGLDQKASSITEQTLSDLAKASTEATVERIIDEARYRMLQGSDPSLIEGGPPLLSPSNAVPSETMLSTLRNKRAQLTSELARLESQFGPNYPQVQEVQAQLQATSEAIQKEQTRVLNEAETNFKAAQHHEQMTGKALTAERDAAFSQRNDLASYQMLLQDYASHRELYETLLSRLREAGITAGLESSEIDVVDLAEPPLKPSDLGPLPRIALCLLFSFISACVVILLINIFDSTLHDSEQIEELTGLPALVALPTIQEGKQRPIWSRKPGLRNGPEIAILNEPHSPFSEAIRILVRSLIVSVPYERRAVLITSALPGEGKSTVSANIAIALAQAGRKVALVDCDLRRPSIHSMFNLTNSSGVSTFISGNTSFEESVYTVDHIPNLSVIPSGPLPSLAAELLDSEGMNKLVDRLIRESFYVLFDSPPAGQFADAYILSRLAAGTLLVFRAGRADRGWIRRTVRKLSQEGAKLLGFALNGVAIGKADYYYYSAYREEVKSMQ